MKAYLLENFGDDVTLRDIPRPRPGTGQLLIRVKASGVNPLDIKIRNGVAAHAQVEVPAVLGLDLAGEVVEVVPGTGTRFAVGDDVYGLTGGVGPNPGSLSEYVAADADLVAHAPRRLTAVEAAALPLVGITAWEALVDHAQVHTGQVVLVHGGAGGVGSAAVQIARARGATVFATARGEGLDVVAQLGATPIDATTPVEVYLSAATGGRGFDVVLDTLGGTVLDDSFASVRSNTGHVVSILGWGTHSLAPLSFRGGTYSGVFTLLPLLTGEGRRHHGEILEHLAAMVDHGALIPRVSARRFGSGDVAAAHQAVESGNAHGKVVIDLFGLAVQDTTP